MKVLLFDNYDSFTWNIVELLRGFDVEVIICKNDEAWIEDFDCAILSPGPNVPQESGRLMRFIEQFASTKPILGICLGHQALALHFGAQLENLKEPLHGEEKKIEVSEESLLFNGMDKEFSVGLYHSWSVAESEFPSELSITARSKEGIIMGIEHKQLPLFGVQFHPESFMSEYGKEILQNYLMLADSLQKD